MSSRADFPLNSETPQAYTLVSALNYIWDIGTLRWVVQTASGGGGGGPATIADGADVAEGSRADAAWVSGSGTVISLLKTIASSGAAAGLTDAQLRATPVPVSGTFFQATQPVSGTFFQATQPVSGTVTTTPPANASTNVAQLAGTATSVNSGVKDAGTLRVVLATDQPALTNKLLVTPDSVALPANQSVNVAQLAGTATSVNSGVKDAGTLRIVLATDQPALTNKLLVTPDSVALPANQSVNVAQFGASAVVTGLGVSGAGIPRITVSSDTVHPVTLQGNGGTLAEVDGTTFRAVRVVQKPFEYGAFGHYRLSATIPLVVSQAALGTLFSFRWGDATRVCSLLFLRLTCLQTAVATATIFPRFQVVIARGFTASDTVGTAITLTGNNMKTRTSMGTTLVTDIRQSAVAAGLTAGTRTLDANPILDMPTQQTITTADQQMYVKDMLIPAGLHPHVFAQNEGFIVRGPTTVFGIAGTADLTVDIAWLESTVF
jgi:hypothetical protein